MEGKVNLLYLNFPVVVRYLHESGFFAEAGLQPGILLSAKRNTKMKTMILRII